MKDAALSAELLDLLGLEDYLRLVEAHGGTRLKIPRFLGDTKVAREFGADVERQLVERFGGSYVRVPLDRERRARRYREEGMTNAQIARRLGMTETGVDKIFHAMPRKPVKGVDPRQADLFPPD